MKNLVAVTLLMLSAMTLNGQTVILYGNKSSPVELNAALDLKSDIQHVYSNESVKIQKNNKPVNGTYDKLIIIGTRQSNKLIDELFIYTEHQLLQTPLAPETFVIQTFPLEEDPSSKATYIIGSDDRGTYYGVYEFSKKVLGIDPYEYWTGKKPEAPPDFKMPEMAFREKAPVFALRGYFDNDDDMLANWKGRKLIVELDIWKEMINSLARLRYNYIDIHDLLGRSEYWQWDYYKNMTDYHTDLNLVDQVIDYAHSKGMMVQIPMYLGWEFHHMDLDKVCLTEHYDHWMEVYEYYLTKTPLGKCDIYLQRPRHPYYDWAYKCEQEDVAGIKPGPLMTKMFKGMSDLIEKHRLGAILVCDLWREGRPMWKSGEFAPEKKVQMLWADYYGGDFREWPEDLKGYDFGIYIHAGIWLNHVIQDPLVYQIASAVNEAVSRDMTNNIFVNGQDFKHFILNLEVCSNVAWDPEGFDPGQFYTEWTTRYFGREASPFVVNSLKLLNEAHKPVSGFKDIMAATVSTLNNVKKGDFNPKRQLTEISMAAGLAKMSLEIAESTVVLVPEEKQMAYDDQIVFPATIFFKNIKLLESVTLFCEFMGSTSDNQEAYEYYSKGMKDALMDLRSTLDAGSKWKKWEGWTKCENFRVYTPPPGMEEVDGIINKYHK